MTFGDRGGGLLRRHAHRFPRRLYRAQLWLRHRSRQISRSARRQAPRDGGADHAGRDAAAAARAGLDGGGAGIAGILVTGLRAIAAVGGTDYGGRGTGQIQDGPAIDRDAGPADPLHLFPRRFLRGGMFVLWIAMVLSVWSGIEYFVKARALSAAARIAAAGASAPQRFDKRAWRRRKIESSSGDVRRQQPGERV